MFLTKKNANSNKKPNKNNKALGGWGDEDDEPQAGNISSAAYSKMTNQNPLPQKSTPYSSYSSKKESVNVEYNSHFHNPVSDLLSGSESNSLPSSKKESDRFYTLEELSTLENMYLYPNKSECECNSIYQILKPGGVRLRQNEILLQEFLNEVRNLDVGVVGSMLVGQLYGDAGFETKAKSLYAIEYLCKKSVQYSTFFKLHKEKIINCPESEENNENFNKIKRNVLILIGAESVKKGNSHENGMERGEESGIVYEDPGYGRNEVQIVSGQKKNIEKTKDKPAKKLISPMDAKNKVLEGPKKKVIGPSAHSEKEKEMEDLLELEKGTKTNAQKETNLLEEGTNDLI